MLRHETRFLKRTPQRPFKVVTVEEDADATDPEVFSGPATKPSLEKPIEARTSISEVPGIPEKRRRAPPLT